ncbi:MAG: 16S rRNA (uracil(1498)-N(3))-methyltransferase [Bacteroidales bacterium]|nr:16S rRNA (uracil(1498)-N(3))-methyltransferase [Bacteroidales bacterium]
MELFYSKEISDGATTLDEQESKHCLKVLRHKAGDEIFVIDGCGCLYKCIIENSNSKVVAYKVVERIEGYGAHPYHLHMAVAPPKNAERFEWFAQKATEIGIDSITPIAGDYSERKVYNTERCERIIVSAAKQSHKGAIPEIRSLCSVRELLATEFDKDVVKIICYCDNPPLDAVKRPIKEIVASAKEQNRNRFVIMIGPEGDFSRDEITLAVHNGWSVASIGESRLRIETAALTAVAAVYLEFS